MAGTENFGDLVYPLVKKRKRRVERVWVEVGS